MGREVFMFFVNRKLLGSCVFLKTSLLQFFDFVFLNLFEILKRF